MASNSNINNSNINNSNINNNNNNNITDIIPDINDYNKNILNENSYISIKRMRKMARKKSNEFKYDNLLDILLHKTIPKKTFISKLKITEETFSIPEYKHYNWLLLFDYKINYLKYILKAYNLKYTGNKNELIKRAYNYLYLSYNIIFIQKIFRSFLIRRYINLHGPGFKNRNLCVNKTDFCTMENIKDIIYSQFISFKDDNEYIYGFNILSLYNLFLKNSATIENPYTKKPLSIDILKNILKIVKYSKLLDIDININFKDLETNHEESYLELRIISLFHDINLLGNYSNSSWFNNLNKDSLILFLNELIDIWNYRANIPDSVKREICPPTGNPFRQYISINMHLKEYLYIKKICLIIMELLVKSGINTASKSLGAYYILSCLTLVNTDAALAMPWLYQAVHHN